MLVVGENFPLPHRIASDNLPYLSWYGNPDSPTRRTCRGTSLPVHTIVELLLSSHTAGRSMPNWNRLFDYGVMGRGRPDSNCIRKAGLCPHPLGLAFTAVMFVMPRQHAQCSCMYLHKGEASMWGLQRIRQKHPLSHVYAGHVQRADQYTVVNSYWNDLRGGCQPVHVPQGNSFVVHWGMLTSSCPCCSGWKGIL